MTGKYLSECVVAEIEGDHDQRPRVSFVKRPRRGARLVVSAVSLPWDVEETSPLSLGGGAAARALSLASSPSLRLRKRKSARFRQQRLPSWEPPLAAHLVARLFFAAALLCVPLGAFFLHAARAVRQHQIDYTGTEPGSPCYKCLNVSRSSTPCHCVITFTLDQPFEGKVLMHYGLANFYQNNRRYVRSRDDLQLNGRYLSLLNPAQECEPYHMSEKKPIAPCGIIANSMFNDTWILFRIDPNVMTKVPLIKKGIAWWTDKNVKFRNPVGDEKNLALLFNGTAKPVNWPKPVYMLDSDPENNGFINEDFIVWMRTAAFPTFRKVYRIIESAANLQPTLPAGNYSLAVTYNYPVHGFDGRKRIILSTVSWMGRKNLFVGIACIMAGCISFFLGVLLICIHCIQMHTLKG